MEFTHRFLIRNSIYRKREGKIEESKITTGENKDYPDAETNGETQNKIFLLSLGEITGTGEGENQATYNYGFKTELKQGYDRWYKETDNHTAKNNEYVADGCGKAGDAPNGSGETDR